MAPEAWQDSIDPRILETALKKAREVLSRDQIKMADFIDLYGVENVRKDEAYVRRREADFLRQQTPETKQAKELATVFEAIIHEHGEQSDWFGPYATTVKVSPFDDIAGGVDSLLEFQEEGKPASQLALAIDVTYSHQLRDKFERIKREIDNGELAEIKYFHSDATGFTGKKTNVPRIVIGADPSIVQALAVMWLEGKNDFLGKHPIQFQILDEAIMQCRAFAQYARKKGKFEVAEKYENDLKILEQILKEKSKTLRDSGMRDGIWEEIRDQVSRL